MQFYSKKPATKDLVQKLASREIKAKSPSVLAGASAKVPELGADSNIANWEYSRNVFHLPLKKVDSNKLSAKLKPIAEEINEVIEQYEIDTGLYWVEDWWPSQGDQTNKLPPTDPGFEKEREELWTEFLKMQADFKQEFPHKVQARLKNFPSVIFQTAQQIKREVKSSKIHGAPEMGIRNPQDIFTSTFAGCEGFEDEIDNTNCEIISNTEPHILLAGNKDVKTIVDNGCTLQAYKDLFLEKDEFFRLYTEYLQAARPEYHNTEDKVKDPVDYLLGESGKAYSVHEAWKKNPKKALNELLFRYEEDSKTGYIDHMVGISQMGLTARLDQELGPGEWRKQSLFKDSGVTHGNLETVGPTKGGDQWKKLPPQLRFIDWQFKDNYQPTSGMCPYQRVPFLIVEYKSPDPELITKGVLQNIMYTVSAATASHQAGMNYPIYNYSADGPVGILGMVWYCETLNITFVFDYLAKVFDLRNIMDVYKLAVAQCMIGERMRDLAKEAHPDTVILKTKQQDGAWDHPSQLAHNKDNSNLQDMLLASREAHAKKVIAEAQAAERKAQDNFTLPIRGGIDPSSRSLRSAGSGSGNAPLNQVHVPQGEEEDDSDSDGDEENEEDN
ncbi:hypothetical protein BDN72DRAFT_905823 [Pluteus cervinus]|uniref:Uncharacterized protein n=1 Tax=Pluteus cervinus TaxID=181527 RepID=A0ACD3A3P5_9AGAR|nr:hypothetical protein BDN72DRAFT_905823 [Pluteus cervinus]